MNTQSSAHSSILDDVNRLGILVAEIVSDPKSGDLFIPAEAGSDNHISDLTAELVQLAPATLAAVTLHHAAGDATAARAAVRESLNALRELSPNAFTRTGVAKPLYRLLMRRTIADQISADASADRASIVEARREARKIADMRGWLLSELVDEAVALDADLRNAAIAREAAEAKRLEDFRRRSRGVKEFNPELHPLHRHGIRVRQ